MYKRVFPSVFILFWKMIERLIKIKCSFPGFLQYGRIESRDGQSGRSNERFKCYNSVRIPMLMMTTTRKQASDSFRFFFVFLRKRSHFTG